jgi:glycosyltransferase involved in cell wall biosynthesis
MKILHLNHSDSVGGAAKFTRRLHDALLTEGISSFICCSSVKAQDPRILNVNPELSSLNAFFRAKSAQFLDGKITRFEYDSPRNFKSPGLVGAVKAKWINDSDFDVIHLHWINGGLISIKEIGKINKPIVWSMLDMWPFMGSEHYVDANHDNRWIGGYENVSRSNSSKGLDISRISAKMKIRYWTENKNIKFVSPTNWLARHAKQSYLLQKNEISVVPAAINTNLFKPEKVIKAREITNQFSIGYGGAYSGRKGWLLFKEFLNTYNENLVGSQVITFGAPISSEFRSPYYDVKQFGQISDEEKLVEIYNRMDVLVFPSLVETFGLIAQEAQSCGVPVICIKDTGTSEVIEHEKTGFEISSNINDLNRTLSRLKEESGTRESLALNSRARATKLWSQTIVAKKYIELYSN